MNTIHGGDIKSFAKKTKCCISDIVDLSSNINFVKPKIKINQKKLDLDIYPNYGKLYRSLERYCNINKGQLELYNGASSAIFALMGHLKQTKCYIYSPAYLEYKKAAKKYNKDVILINRFKPYTKSITKNSLIVFVNPSTPDGQYYNIKSLLKQWQKRNCTVIVDESFLEYAQGKSAVKYLKSYKNLYIIKSMTKFFGCAGVRIGMVLSNKQNIKQLKQQEAMWKISAFDSKYIQKIIKDKKFYQKTLKKTSKNKQYLIKIVKQFKVFKSYTNSDANFILVKLNNQTAQEFQEQLVPYSIMIRDCWNFDFLDNRYVRIAVKSKNDLKKFKKALEKICIFN